MSAIADRRLTWLWALPAPALPTASAPSSRTNQRADHDQGGSPGSFLAPMSASACAGIAAIFALPSFSLGQGDRLRPIGWRIHCPKLGQIIHHA